MKKILFFSLFSCLLFSNNVMGGKETFYVLQEQKNAKKARRVTFHNNENDVQFSIWIIDVERNRIVDSYTVKPYNKKKIKVKNNKAYHFKVYDGGWEYTFAIEGTAFKDNKYKILVEQNEDDNTQKVLWLISSLGNSSNNKQMIRCYSTRSQEPTFHYVPQYNQATEVDEEDEQEDAHHDPASVGDPGYEFTEVANGEGDEGDAVDEDAAMAES